MGWTDDISPVNAARLNYMESGIQDASTPSIPQFSILGAVITGVNTGGVWTKINAASIQATSDPDLVQIEGNGSFTVLQAGVYYWALVTDVRKAGGTGSGEIGVGLRIVGNPVPGPQAYGYNSMTISTTIKNSLTHIGLAVDPGNTNLEIVYETSSFNDPVFDFIRLMALKIQ